MKRTIALLMCVAGMWGASGLTAPSASAAWVRPAHAPLLDAAGNDSGCEANAPAMRVFQNNSGEYLLGDSNTMLCDKAWGKVVWNTGMWEVMPDGTRVVERPMGQTIRGGQVLAGEPVIVRGNVPCSAYPGTHTFLTRAKMKVKTDKASTNPYTAIVERVTTITCPA